MNRYGSRSKFLNRLDHDTYLFHTRYRIENSILDIEMDILFIYLKWVRNIWISKVK